MAATTPDTPPAAKRRISRRRLVVLLSVALFGALLWQGVERFIYIERYRPVIDAELEKLIKLPLTFGEMDLKLFPTPRLVVENVRAGEGDFSVFAPEVSVTASLARLLQKQLALHDVTFHDAQLRMPEGNEAFKARWSDYLAALRAPREATGKPGLRVTLERINAPDLVVMRGAESVANGLLEVLGVTAGAPEFVFDLLGTGEQGQTTARGALTLDVKNDPRLHGSALIRGVPLTALTGDAKLPPLLLDGETTYALAGDASLSVEARGQVRLPDQADALGPFEVTVRRGVDGLRLEGLRVNTLPVRLSGTLDVRDDRSWDLDLAEATLHNQGIAWLVALIPALPVTTGDGVSAEAAMTAVRFGGDSVGGFSFERGAITAKDLGVRIKGGYEVAGIHGSITVENDVYRLSDFSNGHIEAAGTMTLEYATDTVGLNLTGKLNLGPDFPLPEAVSNLLRAQTGTVTIPEFQATFVEGNVQLSTLHIAGALEKGAVSAYDRSAGTFAPATEVTGEGVFKEGALHITRITGPYTTFSGTLTPDETLRRWTVVSKLTSDLSSPLWEFIQPVGVTFLGGKLDCTRLEGVYVQGEKKPEALQVEATAKGVKVALSTGGYKDSIQLDTLALKGTVAEVAYDAGGASGILGPFSAQGTYGIAGGAVRSQVRMRPAEATLIPEAWRGGVGGTVLKALGDVPLTVSYGGTGARLDLSSEAPLFLKGTLDIGGGAKAKAPIGLTLGAALPTAWLAPHLSPAIAPSGAVKLELGVDAASAKISVRADLTEAVLGWSVLEKKAGFPMALSAVGNWGSDGARISAGHVEAGGERIDFTLNAGTLRADQFSVGLAALAPLLPQEGTIGGRIGGSYAGESGPLLLNFDGATAQFAPDLLPVGLDGALTRQGGAWSAEKLAWTIGASQGTLKVTGAGESWRGELQASRIHASELKQGYAAWTARRGLPAQENTPPWSFSGDFSVTADRLIWAEATLENLRCRARFTPGVLRLEELVMAHGAGQLAGVAGYESAREGNPAVLSTDLNVSGVDAVLLEGLFLEKARGLAGPMNGRVALTIPLVSESPSVMHHISGDITFEGRDGTLGKAGLASKLLGALRTTDILRLRIPQLKDKGLSFKTISGHVAITQGVFRLDPFQLADSAYVLAGKATFDYPKDIAEGGGEIQVLEGVTGMARKIPILGDAANLVSKVFGVPIKVSGTAKEPSFGVGVAAPVKSGKSP
ncbi:MAG: hypothetical protein JNK74_00455 [Candidatus Hydrogenedentes bacterium]|nr:hypothetical protein [Candidatus Hydrogenedentota bacterium]